MPNALNTGGMFQSYYAGADDAAASQQQNALAGMRRTQFDQEQQERRRSMLREDGLHFWAGVTQQETPEQRAQLYSQWRPSFVSQHPEAQQFLPEQYDDQAFGQLGFKLLPSEVAQRIVAERYAPRNPIAVSPGTTLIDPQTRQPVYSNPSKAPAAGRPIPVVDQKSPTGFSYQTPEAAVGQPAPAPKSPSNTRYSQREMQMARDKLRLIGLARQQLNLVKESWEGKKNPETGEMEGGIKNTRSAGFLQGWVPSEGGDLFDSRVSQLTPAITAITRVPGVGSMSDYESRLQEATRPQRGRYEGTTQSQIEGVELLLDQLESGYGGILQDGSEPAAGPDLNQTVEDLVEYYAGQD